MNKIKLQDINFSSLIKLQDTGTQGTIYRNDNTCFKILDGFYDDEKEELYKKFMDMDGIKIENVLLPKELIMENGKLQGYSMDYFKDSMCLSNKFLTRYVDCKKLFNYVSKASKILKTMHDNQIICQDLSFENILVDNNDNVAFCDLDGCRFKEHKSPFISMIMKILTS